MSLLLLLQSGGGAPPAPSAITTTGGGARIPARASVSNALRVQLASGYEPELARAEEITFDTFYPGGLFGACSFLVHRDVTRAWGVTQHKMIRVTNGLETVWEGEVAALTYIPGVGYRVECLGYWAGILEARSWRKPWADTRIDETLWPYDTAAPAAEKCDVDRRERIRFTPKAVAWANTEYAAVVYTAPTGETIKRFTCTTALAEGAQQWTLGFDDTVAATHLSITATGTAAHDVTPVVPAAKLRIYFQSNGAHTPASDGSIMGKVTNLVVYTETSAINLTEIAKDVRAHFTDLSATETEIASNNYALVPFVSEGETAANLLLRACGYGDALYNAWGAAVIESARGTDGKPVLQVAQQPVLTGYDYAIRLDEPTVSAGVEFTQDAAEVRNWISVTYRDVEGKSITLTPDDDATLKDAASITAYGERHEWLDLDTTSATVAANYARRFLAQYKDARWQASGGIALQGYIRTAGGGIEPVCRIRAGKRLRIENYLNDLNGTGLTLLISGTSYDAARETNTLTVGIPDFLSVQMARMEKQ